APRDTRVSFLLSEQESKVYGDGPRRVKPGDIVLDCGANVGVFTREALDAGASLVVSIEPSARNVECLRRNFATEVAAGKVIVYPKGVWDKDDEMVMYVYKNSALDSFVMNGRTEESGRPVPQKFKVTTIDEIANELKLPRVDFIKMDI